MNNKICQRIYEELDVWNGPSKSVEMSPFFKTKYFFVYFVELGGPAACNKINQIEIFTLSKYFSLRSNDEENFFAENVCSF